MYSIGLSSIWIRKLELTVGPAASIKHDCNIRGEVADFDHHDRSWIQQVCWFLTSLLLDDLEQVTMRERRPIFAGLLIVWDNRMETLFHHLGDFVGFLSEEWMWSLLGSSLLFVVWFRNATSPLPARRVSLGRR